VILSDWTEGQAHGLGSENGICTSVDACRRSCTSVREQTR